MALTMHSQKEKRILLIEDQKQFYQPIQRWLSEEGYTVDLATTYEAAVTAIQNQYFHLAIVDLSLVKEDVTDQQGIDLLLLIEQKGLNRVMPCIVLTANANVENVLLAYQQAHVAHFIEKSGGYRSKLLTAVSELYRERIRVNFELQFDGRSHEMIHEIANDVNWSMGGKPREKLLQDQIHDLFGKLFYDARRVHITKLKPGLTGAAISRVQPTWKHGLGPRFVAKIGRAEKVNTEATRYEEYVKPYLPPNTIAQIKDVAYTRDVGALLYTFAEDEMVPLREFDEFYQSSNELEIVKSLRDLFNTTCRYWYEAPQRIIEDLPELYYRAFQLDEQKLVQRIQTVLPKLDPTAPEVYLPKMGITVRNPIAWLRDNRHEFEMPTYHCITHGDLTGRNIMVNQNGKCWLIDFYRTYDSHILRDFVILETDVKYRLMEKPSPERFLRMEEALLLTDESGDMKTQAINIPKNMRKAVAVVNALRAIAYGFVSGGFRTDYQQSRREYFISLLMTTLNVTRLRHIDEDRKLHAMLSASLLCAELDKLAGRTPQWPTFDQPEDLHGRPTAVPIHRPGTAQQQFLAEQLDDQSVMLFLGSDTPTGFTWPDTLASLTPFPWTAVFTVNRHSQLEDAYQQQKRPFSVVDTVELGMRSGAGGMPIYKLYGSNADAAGNGTARPVSRAQACLTQIRENLHAGQSILLLCTSESELMMVHDACYTNTARGLIWAASADFSEEAQDEYRDRGLRVLPDTPEQLLTALAALTQP